MRNRVFFILFGAAISISSSHAQIDVGFIKHLNNQNLQREHFTYLHYPELSPSSDSVNYFKGKYYLKYFNDTMFLNHYFKSYNVFKDDSASLIIASTKFLNGSFSNQETWFKNLPASDSTFTLKSLTMVYTASVNPSAVSPNLLPEPLIKDFLNYKSLYSRSPYIGAVLSGAVPGLGKLYAGRRVGAINSFLATISFAVQYWEAERRLGANHPYTIFSLSVLGIFYGGNVYGGYNAVKKVKAEKKKQFLINASEYFHHSYPFLLD